MNVFLYVQDLDPRTFQQSESVEVRELRRAISVLAPPSRTQELMATPAWSVQLSKGPRGFYIQLNSFRTAQDFLERSGIPVRTVVVFDLISPNPPVKRGEYEGIDCKGLVGYYRFGKKEEWAYSIEVEGLHLRGAERLYKYIMRGGTPLISWTQSS